MSMFDEETYCDGCQTRNCGSCTDNHYKIIQLNNRRNSAFPSMRLCVLGYLINGIGILLDPLTGTLVFHITMLTIISGLAVWSHTIISGLRQQIEARVNAS